MLLAVVVAVGVGVLVLGRGGDLPRSELRAFLAAWSDGDTARVDQLAVRGSGAGADQAQFRDALRISRSSLQLEDFSQSEDGATADITAVHEARGLGEWRCAPRSGSSGATTAGWSTGSPRPCTPTPSVKIASSANGRGRSGRRSSAPTASPLTVVGRVVAIGVQPARIGDQAAVATALQGHVGVDPARLDAALKAPGVKPDHFVPLIEVREERYRQVEPALRPVPGVVFQRKDARITLAEGFAAHTVGRTGEITAEQLEELGPTYQQGDVVGRSGLELAYERQLAGAPSGEIRLVKASGQKQVLHRVTGSAPRPVTTTLRPDLQRAADAALDGVTAPAALVALDARTGAIVAVASRPLSEPFNRALSGQYPPGSTFKIVTTDALIAAGGADQRLSCPATATVGGKPFKNFEGDARDQVTLREALVQSCNTAFASAAANLSNDQLVEAARRYGFDVEYSISSGRTRPAAFPEPKDEAERAAAAIGQGRVLASPAHMASVIAAATTGTWRAPHLLRTEAGTADVPTASPTPSALDPLRDFMRGVVAEGTARAAASVPGLVGKTGTAEFGSGDPLPTHAWFLGERNGIAFAVLVEGGGVGGRVAAPIGARFASAT